MQLMRQTAAITTATLAVALVLTPATDRASAQTHSHDHAPAVAMADGEVRRVDKETGRITIRHGEIKNLDMPPMTMVFRVKDPAMLDQLKAGDRIQFSADKIGGQYTLTSFLPAK